MSAAELEDLKSTLRSLVVSSPTSMDTHALARDYRSESGDHIPYAKYGYRDLLTFLKERCIDSFVFSGRPTNPTITPIINERTRGVNELISKQRISSKDPRKRVKRTSVHESQMRYRNDTHNRRSNVNTVHSPQATESQMRRINDTNNSRSDVNTVPAPRAADSQMRYKIDTNHRRSEVNTVLGPQPAESQMSYKNDANNRRSEVNTVSPPQATRKIIAQAVDRHCSRPITKCDVKYSYKNANSAEIGAMRLIEKHSHQNRDESGWTGVGVHRESEHSAKDYQNTKVQIVRGGELRSIENQLLQRRHDKECVKERALKHMPTISDIPALMALPQFVPKNMGQYDRFAATKGAISKEHVTASEKQSSRSGCSAAHLKAVKSQLEKLLNSNPDGIWLEELEQIYNDTFGNEIDYKQLGHVSLESLCREVGASLRLKSKGDRSRQLVVLGGQPAPRVSPTPPSSQHPHSRYNVLYLNSIKSQMQEMLDSYPGGVWLQQLAEFYRDMFSCDLDYKRLGHASVESLCGDLGSVLRLEDAGAGYKLAVAVGRPTSRDQPAPPPPLPPPPPPRSRLARYDDTDELSGDSDDALGGMPYDEGIFPEDCMDRLQSAPRLPVSTLAAGQVVEVLVSEVLDPSHFWFQLRSEHHDLALNNLMDEMTEYYQNGAGRDRVMQFGAVQVGQYCATKFDVDGWHRSIIVQLIGPHSVKVRHVDYGSVITVGRKELRYLRKEWATLPTQALRGCLAQLRPAGGASCWMHSAARRFLELVNNRPLVAEIHSVDTQAQVVRMFLADTTSEKDVYINKQLVDENRASHVDFNSQTLGDFLLPSFDDVENGKALNFADKCELLKSGIFPEGMESPFSLPVVVRRDDAPSPPPASAAAPASGRSATSATRIPLFIPYSTAAGSAARCSSRETSVRSPALLAINRKPLPNNDSPLQSPDRNSPLDCEIDELSLKFSHMNGFMSRPGSQLSCSTMEMNRGTPVLSSAGWQPQTHQTNDHNFLNELHEPARHLMLDSDKHQSDAPIPMPGDFTHYLNYSPSMSLEAQLKMSTHPPPQMPQQFNNDYYLAMNKNSNSVPRGQFSQQIPQYPYAPHPSTYSSQLETTQPNMGYQYHTQHHNQNPLWTPDQNYNAATHMHPTQGPNMNSHFQHAYNDNVNNMFYPTQPQNMNMLMQPMQQPNVGTLMPPFQQPPVQYPNIPFSNQPIQYPYKAPMEPVPLPNMEYPMHSAQHVPKEYSPRPDVSSVWDLAKDINTVSASNSIQMALSSLDSHYREMKMSIAGVAPPNLTQTRPSAAGNVMHRPCT